MAQAIEKSICVLVCVTEKYKESNFCRLEAEYLTQKNKPFIPILMEKGYRAAGWLGIILGSKIFVDFTKLEFSNAMNELNRNLDLILKNKPLTPILNSKPDQNVDQQPLDSVIGNLTQKPIDLIREEAKWSENQVEMWLKEKDINQIIVENLAPCNGQGKRYMINFPIVDPYKIF